ncbi:hypothetical protein EDD37DRAFT_658046 [Exophiala viscosa]|uniref:uncharacterized protein n=1 Tax=Exophiala viscosa TaxID=2486360 RepID=UPI0021A12BA0|nr:hypothetical protein EDD37DRAFT_658046 [Exophiala viscosa]
MSASTTSINHIEPCDRGRDWATQSKRCFDSRTEAVSVTAIQGCALLANLAFIEGDAMMESLYAAQAIRMVQLLDLPRRLSADSVQQETEIRIWWTVWMTDAWTSTSLAIPPQLIVEPAYPPPMEEAAFTNLRSDRSPDAPASTAHERESGLWTQMIPLTQIMAKIHTLNTKAMKDVASGAQILEEVEQLSFQLDLWRSRLPDHLESTPANLQAYADRGLGRVFAALHFGYHHHSQVLCYRFLRHAGENSHQQPFSTAFLYEHVAQNYASRCKYHALELSKLMWKTNTTAGLECLWAINGHLLVIASSTHLHTLLFEGNEASRREAKELLEQNFKMLLQLQRYWPCLYLSMSRLKAFHRACEESMDQSFDMDQWMLHFLQQYASPAGDRFMGLGKDSESANGYLSHSFISNKRVTLSFQAGRQFLPQ